jgi:hypothetical protein
MEESDQDVRNDEGEEDETDENEEDDEDEDQDEDEDEHEREGKYNGHAEIFRKVNGAGLAMNNASEESAESERGMFGTETFLGCLSLQLTGDSMQSLQ